MDITKMFKVKDLGQAKFILGINVAKEENACYLNQRKYALETAEKFKIQIAAGVNTPAMRQQDGRQDAKPLQDTMLYRSMVRSLMYLAMGTRPDIAFAVHRAARYFQAPTDTDLQDVVRILQYIAKNPK